MPIDTKNLIPFTLTHSSSGACCVTIRLAGIISFSAAAVHGYDLRKIGKVVLFYDKANNALVIGKAPGTESFAREIKFQKNTGYLQVKSFFNYFNIKLVRSLTFDLHCHKESGLLYIELMNGVPTPSSFRAKGGNG
jgi:hypothetical protein